MPNDLRAHAVATRAMEEMAERPAHAGAFESADCWRARAAKAEGLVAGLIARLDLGGEPAAVLADLAEMLDGARRQVPPAGGEV